MSNHTPAPWILDYDKGIGRDVLSLKHGGICTVRRAGRHDDATFKANADLIAAAPELLEALKELYEYTRKLTMLREGLDACTKARAAINKAEGKQ